MANVLLWILQLAFFKDFLKSILPACRYMQRPEKTVRFPGTGVTDGC